MYERRKLFFLVLVSIVYLNLLFFKSSKMDFLIDSKYVSKQANWTSFNINNFSQTDITSHYHFVTIYELIMPGYENQMYSISYVTKMKGIRDEMAGHIRALFIILMVRFICRRVSQRYIACYGSCIISENYKFFNFGRK